MHRKRNAILAALALLLIGFAPVGVRVFNDSATEPGDTSRMWLKDRAAAVYDTTTTNWYGLDSHVVIFGDNSTSDGQEWLKYDMRPPSDTTGAADDYWSAGYSPMWDATIQGVWGNSAGDVTAGVSCTLKVFITGLGTGTTSPHGAWVFSLPGTYEWPDTTWDLDKDEVMSVWLGAATATLDYPNFHFRVVERR